MSTSSGSVRVTVRATVSISVPASCPSACRLVKLGCMRAYGMSLLIQPQSINAIAEKSVAMLCSPLGICHITTIRPKLMLKMLNLKLAPDVVRLPSSMPSVDWRSWRHLRPKTPNDTLNDT